MGTVEPPEPRISILEAKDCTCRNEHPHLDEFVAQNVTVHFEQMADAQFWIGITLPNGRTYHINCGAVNPRVKGYSFVEVDI